MYKYTRIYQCSSEIVTLIMHYVARVRTNKNGYVKQQFK